MAKKYINKTTGTETITKARNIVVAAPYDVRGVVETYADLLDKDTYSYSELYVGMLVITYDTQDVYVLTKLPGSRDNATAWAQNIKWKKINDVNKDDISEFLTASDLDVYALKSELPIVPTNVSAFTNDAGYLTENDLPDFLLESDLDGYVKTEDLAGYIPVSELESLASKSDLDGYVKTEDAVEYLTSSDLDAYALKSDIPVVPVNVSAFTNDAGYLTKNDLPDFLEASDLEDYVKTEDLEAYIPKTELESLASKSDLDGYVRTEDAVEFLTASDLDIYALKSDIPEIPENVSTFVNDAGYLTENDLPDFLEASDLDGYVKTEELANYIPATELENLATKSDLDGYVKTEDAIEYLTASDLDDYLKVSELPTNVSEFTNDAGYITSEDVPSIKTINNKSLVGEGNVDVLEVIEFTGSNTGELSQELYDKLAGEGCVVKYNNRIYHKSYVSPNGIDYTYIGHTLANDDVKYYYFTADSEFRGYTFGTTTDARARVFANREISGETQELRNLVIGFDKFTIPDFLEASDLEDYVRIEDLTPYATKEDIANFVEQSDLDIYVKTNDILTLLESDYAKKEELVDFLTASDLEDYVRVEDIADVVRTDDLDYYVKVEDAVDFLTASDLDGYALKSELPVNVSELTNDVGYLTQHQDLSAYALKSELPLEGTFPTDSDSDSDIDDGYATVQGVIDYVDAYFEKKKDELEEPDYIYVNGIKIEDLSNLPTPTSIYQMNQYEIDDNILTNGLMVLIDNEILGFDGEGDPNNAQQVIYSIIFSFDVPTNYSVNYYVWDENTNDWSTVSDIVVSNPRYSTKQYGRKTYNCYVRYTEGDNYYTALNTTVKYKITINKI